MPAIDTADKLLAALGQRSHHMQVLAELHVHMQAGPSWHGPAGLSHIRTVVFYCYS